MPQLSNGNFDRCLIAAELRNSQIERNKNTLEALKNRDSELASNLIRSHLEMMLSDVIIL